MRHLTSAEIERAAEQAPDASREPHLAECTECRQAVASERKFARALSRIPRAEPRPDLAARIQAALPPQIEPNAWLRPNLMAIATILAGGLLLVVAYQTIVELQLGGAWDFVSLFASRPDILSAYPFESLSALAESLPLLELALTFGLLVVTVILAQELFLLRRAVGHGWARPNDAQNGPRFSQ